MTVLSGKAQCNLCQAMLKPKTWWFYWKWKWCWYNSALAAQYLHFILCFWGTNCFKSGRVWRRPVSTQYSNITDGLDAKPLHKTTNFICFHLNRPKGFQKCSIKPLKMSEYTHAANAFNSPFIFEHNKNCTVMVRCV